MKLNFQKSLSEFKYLLCFDLAKFETGISLINIEQLDSPHIINVYQLSVDKKTDDPFGEFYDKLQNFFKGLQEQINFKDVLLVREKQPQGFNVATTISTLQALAGVHAILSVAAHQYDLYEYEDGIHASSVKAWARHKLEIDKPQKEDIQNFLFREFPYLIVKQPTYDITDSIALAICLIEEKWNNDLKDIIKQEKKHLKELKLQRAIIKQQEKIQDLENKKINTQ